jgi:polyhydroxyalkanoate synthase
MNLGNSPTLAPQYMAMIPPVKLSEIQKKYLEDLGKLGKDPDALEIKDRRFQGQAWQNPWSKALVSTYLLNSRYLNELVNAVETDPKTLQRIEFTTQQMIDALSPANFFATNPEALETILQTQGQSLQKGIVNLLGDLGKGKVSQTDESGFEVGQNLAQTEGAVVFRNKLFELIQYKPLTDQVYERPFLMVPPCINKYYILDLQPDNSEGL